jgi:GrpB-like predicted nucleotidyltransferase (UPF0157 family)
MLTDEQEKWINHLSDTDHVSVIPHDPSCEEKFLQVKQKIQSILGSEQVVVHRGASALGISGQDEIDVYVPVAADEFDEVMHTLIDVFGKPRSHYHLQRARFVTSVESKHVDVFVINKDDGGWKDSEKFYNFLVSHPQELDEYRKLKEESAGQSTREYYRKKIEFFNALLSDVDHNGV